MGITRPSTKADDFEGNSSIQAFLSCAINYALSTAAYLVEQLVVAKMHRDSRVGRGFTIFISRPAKAGLEQTTAAKSAGCVGQDCSSAFCADSWSTYHFV